MRILLVDDEPLVLKSYARYLNVFLDQTVVTAGDGTSALAHLESGEHFDMIFCDVTMQPMNGIDLHKAICGLYPDMADQFVFLTGGIIDATAEAYIRDSGAYVLDKPADKSDFEKALASVHIG